MPPKTKTNASTRKKRTHLEINSVPDINQREKVPTPPAAKKRKKRNLSRDRFSSSSSENSPSNSQQQVDSPTNDSSVRPRVSSNFEKYLQVGF